MSLCAAFLSWVGVFAAGFCDQLWQIYLTQGVIAATGQGGGTVLFSTVPAQWFKKVCEVGSSYMSIHCTLTIFPY